YFTTTFSDTGRMPVSGIEFSRDSSVVSVIPENTFYSKDSVHCYFRGFSGEYMYSGTGDFLPDPGDTLETGYDWYFLTGNSGFYSYPNPYKPGSNPEHKRCGGIWFKNLHTLKQGVTDVYVVIYDLHAHPVFDSRDGMDGLIHFELEDPDHLPVWKWDTRNASGKKTASGYYMYAVYDRKGNALVRGRIVIVR
ncbi:MAG: hypothetical protein ACOCSE_00520, partial [Chitinivibrionales bacterium]